MDRLSTNSTIQQPEAIKVILADDNGDITSLLSDYLSGKPDIEVTGCASDGMELMNMLRERPCDILVMDLIMPALDGFAVLSMMDTLPVRPRTLVLTALGRGRLYNACDAAGRGLLHDEAVWVRGAVQPHTGHEPLCRA